jgi:hypothetical protein
MPVGKQIAWWVGLVAHLVVLVWYAASGLVAPSWAVAVLLFVWAVLLAVGLRLRTTTPVWMLAVPVAAAAFWFVFISAGEKLFGWTA